MGIHPLPAAAPAARRKPNNTYVAVFHLARKSSPLTAAAGTITKVADVAFLILSSKTRTMRYPQYICEIRKGQVTAYAPFHSAFLRDRMFADMGLEPRIWHFARYWKGNRLDMARS